MAVGPVRAKNRLEQINDCGFKDRGRQTVVFERMCGPPNPWAGQFKPRALA